MLPQRLARNIEAHRLLAPGRPVIVAVSGGADSVALLDALVGLGYTCIAAHCNYHLRGDESNRDMRSVQDLCRRLGVDLYVRDFDVDERRRRTGESVEMACRELRYAWFADLLDRERAQAIAVAHHREDNVETFFLNLMRGSGIAGLSGMRWRNGYIVRPLLDLSRADIEQYLADRGIPFVVDSTNASNDFQRNRLRNVVIPAIEANFPGAVDGIIASIAHLADNRDVYADAVEAKRQQYFDGRELQLRLLIDQEPRARVLLFEMLRPLGYNMTHVDNILASASRTGLRFAAGANMLELGRGVLRVLASGADAHRDETVVSLARDILAPVHIVITEHSVAEFRPERDPNVAYFDLEYVAGPHVFALRPWRRGDRMQPYGMTGTKLLSDLFTAARYTADDKRRAWVLTRDGQILWTVGLRASAQGAITPETRRYLRLEYKSPAL